MWQITICAVSFALAIISAMAEEQPKPQSDQDYAVYNAVSDLGLQMFEEVYKRDESIIRTSATLRACSRDGLARVVDAKLSDPTFERLLITMIHEGRFRDLPNYAVFSAQGVANGIRAGYVIGYQQAISLLAAHIKTSICDVAVKNAGDILK